MTQPREFRQIGRTFVEFNGRRLLYFSGCDYFRLASHPTVTEAARAATAEEVLNVSASRMTTGNHPLYGQLERRLAAFFRSPTPLLVSSGYVTNLVVAQALTGEFSHALLDERAHPSLVDAARFLDCPVITFAHRNHKGLAAAARRCGKGAKLLVLTDGMFSHDGSAAPLNQYLKVLPGDAWILVDDAHGAGVLGAFGCGTLQHAGVDRKRIIQTLTLSKAFGSYGGVILGSPQLRERILRRSRMFIGSTPPPLPLAAAACASLTVLTTDRRHRTRLLANARRVKRALMDSPWSASPSLRTPGPIVGLTPDSESQSRQLRQRLLAAGIFPPLVQYPGAPLGGYFRFMISSEHTPEHLDQLVAVLKRAGGLFRKRA